MKSSEIIRNQIFEAVKNQIKNNDPPETKKTYDRLIKLGYNDYETMQLIGQCVSVEIYELLKNQKPYDKDRFVKNLNNLPEEPIE